MGKKGDKMTSASVTAVEAMIEKLDGLDGISFKKMFGGHGVFHEGKMFGMVDSQGQCFLKSDDSVKADFESAGAQRHGRMPYYTIPDDVMNDQDLLLTWVGKSIEVSK